MIYKQENTIKYTKDEYNKIMSEARSNIVDEALNKDIAYKHTTHKATKNKHEISFYELDSIKHKEFLTRNYNKDVAELVLDSMSSCKEADTKIRKYINNINRYIL